MKPSTEPAPKGDTKKPRLALFIATGFGLGYLPVAPGTWGSLLGVGVAVLPHCVFLLLAYLHTGVGIGAVSISGTTVQVDPFVFCSCIIAAAISIVGVWAAGRAANHFGLSDPQKVVIDEVSGQHLALLVGGMLALPGSNSQMLWEAHPLGFMAFASGYWKYLLLGFILFRVFDIWKPFPVRQAERLPGGWGIMADDWLAGIYAALGLWLARALGL
jgi:phosphatidylglycerophosphatase A